MLCADVVLKGGGGWVHIWFILYSGECGIMGFWKHCQRIKPF